MILDLTSTQVGDVEWPAQTLLRVELGPWVAKDARAPLGVEWSTIDGRFGYGTYVTGVIDGHVIAAYVYAPGPRGWPRGPWYDYYSSLGFGGGYVDGERATTITNCVYAPTALAAPWEANPNWYEWEDLDDTVCGAGLESGE